MFKEIASAFTLSQSTICPFGLFAAFDSSEVLKELVPTQKKTLKWLQHLRRQKNVRLMLLTDGKEEHAANVMTRAFGSSWKGLFHVIAYDAKKSKLFGSSRECRNSHPSRNSLMHGNALLGQITAFPGYTPSHAPKPSSLAHNSKPISTSAASLDELYELMQHPSRVVYFGDHLKKDITGPVLLNDPLCQWSSVGVNEEVDFECIHEYCNADGSLPFLSSEMSRYADMLVPKLSALKPTKELFDAASFGLTKKELLGLRSYREWFQKYLSDDSYVPSSEQAESEGP